MSSITFPSDGPSTSAHDGQFFGHSFDANASFQMNPLSSHPPRTPRVSIASSSRVYGRELYESKEEVEEQGDMENGELDEEEDRVREAECKVRSAEVWKEMFLTSDGRDKAFKLMQYSIRVYLFFHTGLTTSRLLRRPTRPPWEKELVKRLNSAMSGFSFTRKLLLLFNWLTPLTAIMAQQTVHLSSDSGEGSKQTSKPFIQAALYAPPPVLLELVHAAADDVATFARLGIIGKKTGDRAGRFSDWCWLLATLVGLVENGLERQVIGNLQHEVESRAYKESMSGATAKSKPTSSKIDEKELHRLQNKDYWLQISRAKLIMDLIFVSYDVFRIKRGRVPMKAFSGLAAAILSSAKLYNRHKNTLVKSLLAQ